MRKMVIGSLLLGAVVCNALPAVAQTAAYERYIASGQKAFDGGQYRSAATSWLKALPSLESANQPIVYARILTRLAAAYNAQSKPVEAADYLQRALTVYQTLNGVTPEFASVFNNVSTSARTVNVDVLGGPSSRALKANSAKVVLAKADAGAKVQIDVPARFESNLNSDKIDQLGLEPSVSFNVSKDAAGNTTVANIKGFKIHSVEKGMWVNLLNLIVRQPDGSGKYDAEITAGKAGVQKVVQSKLPASVVEPIAAIAKEIDAMSVPPALPLPVLATLDQPSEPAATTPASQPAAQPVAPPESAKVEPVQVEPPKVEPVKVEPVKVEPPKVEPAKVEDSQVEDSKPAPRVVTPPSTESPAKDPPKKAKSRQDKDDDDDDDDDDDKKDKNDKNDKDSKDKDDDKSSQEDDHLIFHMIGKGINKIRGK